jgi:hypothetical protein
MKNSIVGIVFLLVLNQVFSQKNIFLDISPMFQSSSLQMNVNYIAWDGKTIKFDHFDYYLSDVQIFHDGGQSILLDSVFLVEPQNHTLYLGGHNVNQIEQISFIVGVPKPMNTQTGAEAIDISLYPENHPLSFQTPSMYWGWQAGYMHMILGGYADDNGDGSLEAYFEMHNLGNQNQKLVEFPNVIQTNTSSNQIDIFMNCRVDRWINSMPLSTVGVAHGETGLNATILNNVLTQDVFIQPANASIESIHSDSKIYFSNDQNSLEIHWKELNDLEKIRVVDINGKIISEFTTNESQSQLSIENLEKGYYIVQFFNKNSLLIGSLNAVH